MNIGAVGGADLTDVTAIVATYGVASDLAAGSRGLIVACATVRTAAGVSACHTVAPPGVPASSGHVSAVAPGRSASTARRVTSTSRHIPTAVSGPSVPHISCVSAIRHTWTVRATCSRARAHIIWTMTGGWTLGRGVRCRRRVLSRSCVRRGRALRMFVSGKCQAGAQTKHEHELEYGY
jgi:hypothetical protein